MKGISKIKKKLFSSGFIGNVSVIIQGTLFAQAIPILLSPVLSRIYDPIHFGIFTFFLSFVNICALFVNGKFESVLYISDDQQKLVVTRLIFFLEVFLITLITIGILVYISFKPDHWYFILAPFSIFFFGLYNLLFGWFASEKSFKIVSKGKVIRGLLIGSLSLLFGFFNILSLGLVLAFMIGQLGEILFLARKMPYKFKDLVQINKEKWQELIELAKKYKKFPLVFLPASFLQRGTMELPVFFMGGFLGNNELGNYGLMKRVVATPTNLVTNAVSNVMQQKVGENISKNQSNRPFVLRYSSISFFIGILPLIFVFIFGPRIFEFIFGSAWKIAGEYMQILLPIFFFQLMVKPLGTITLLKEKLEAAFLLHAGHFIFTLLAFYIGFNILGSVKYALILYTIVYCCKYFVEFLMAYHYSK